MATNTRSVRVTRRSIAHRAIASCSSHIIDLTMDSPQASSRATPKTFYCDHCLMETDPKQECEITDVRCPLFDCEDYFQDRELRALLTQVEYEQYLQKPLVPNNNNNALMKLDELMKSDESTGFIPSMFPFECRICLQYICAGDGMIIRECEHQFCIDCIRISINSSEKAEIQCLAAGCVSTLQDVEIRSLLTQKEFDEYLSYISRISDKGSLNSFHCNKPNCTGLTICEDDVIFFRCHICSSDNCLQCQAIHPNLNCAQYQENLKISGLDDDEHSVYKMDEIVKNNQGMRCPTCEIVIMKRDGCDWLVCSMCKTELCWATRGPRWGPGGRGDTSGGCKCNLVGKRCHPKCENCH